ncbi:MAG: hypothetical protein ACKO6B_02695 [Planctomycetia bacterium]
MQRVPNPPKVPLPFATVTKSRRSLLAGATSKGRTALAIAVLLSAAFSTMSASTTGLAAAEPGSSITGGQQAVHAAPHNFLVHGTSPARGRLIREHAESMRRDLFAKLLGDADPAPWRARCEIRVHTTAEAFAAAVGGPPADARGATSLEFSGDEVVLRRIDVMGDGAEVVPDAVNHELTHVVLADHFVHAAPPRWADEGLALLFDSIEKQRGHEVDFQEARRRGLSWSAAELVAMEDYPADGSRTRVFYGQSASLVRWMIGRRDAATFIRFLDDLPAVGMEAALDRHYAVGSLDSVSSAWTSDWKEVAPINTVGLADHRR